MSQQAPMIIGEEFREILTTLEKYGKIEYKTVADTLYVPPQGTAILAMEVDVLKPGKIFLVFETGISSTITCLEIQVVIDGNVYAYEPCYQPRLYSWGVNYFKDGIIITMKNYVWIMVYNPTSNPAYVQERVGYATIDSDMFTKIEQKFFSVIRQAIQV
jgi:hypothetical protein